MRAGNPALVRVVARPSGQPDRRRPPALEPLLGLPAVVTATESVTEQVQFAHRARSNNAPLATGRYRR